MKMINSIAIGVGMVHLMDFIHKGVLVQEAIILMKLKVQFLM
jgi:hypothetical protein